MRVAVSGTHGVGKSTLVADLARALPGHVAVPEPYLQMLDEGHAFADPPSIEDYEAQLERSLANLEASGDTTAHSIFERCPADFLAYAAAHEDASKVQLAYEQHRRYPPMLAAPSGVGAVLRTGQYELVPEISEEMLATVARDAEHLALLREIGFVSAMIVPLIARGRTLAALAFVSSQPGRKYGPDDLAFAQFATLRHLVEPGDFF